MSGIGDFLTAAQRRAAEWMRIPRTGPQWGDDPLPVSDDERQRDEFFDHVNRSLAARRCPFSGLPLKRPPSRDDHVYCDVCDCFGFVVGDR